MKEGLLKGKVALASRKLTAPMWIKTNFKFYHNYENYGEFLNHLMQDDLEIYMKFTNGITFKVVMGNAYRSAALRNEFKMIFEEYYKCQGSSIQFDKSGKKIILNLSMKIPEQKKELKEDTVVGVDVGVAIPAVCGLNNDLYEREFIGNAQDFVRIRTKMQSERKRLQKHMTTAKGGHGRKKKLAHLEVLTKKESNFATTYNHMVSRHVVNFAIKHKAAYINMEDLSGYNASDFILRNWSYFQLQKDIEYKAELEGIKVRYINPYHTSQTCSFCGHWEEGQREKQAEFICKNPECKMFNKVINADWNASRNIALSTDFK